MDAPRKILHMDLDAFFCAVEELANPSLKGKAYAVGGSPTGRGVVTSCSYPARRTGVPTQWLMIGALPLMMRYNQEKGRGMKYFFYVFYPAHTFLLFYLANFVIGRG